MARQWGSRAQEARSAGGARRSTHALASGSSSGSGRPTIVLRQSRAPLPRNERCVRRFGVRSTLVKYVQNSRRKVYVSNECVSTMFRKSYPVLSWSVCLQMNLDYIPSTLWTLRVPSSNLVPHIRDAGSGRLPGSESLPVNWGCSSSVVSIFVRVVVT